MVEAIALDDVHADAYILKAKRVTHRSILVFNDAETKVPTVRLFASGLPCVCYVRPQWMWEFVQLATRSSFFFRKSH